MSVSPRTAAVAKSLCSRRILRLVRQKVDVATTLRLTPIGSTFLILSSSMAVVKEFRMPTVSPANSAIAQPQPAPHKYGLGLWVRRRQHVHNCKEISGSISACPGHDLWRGSF